MVILNGNSYTALGVNVFSLKWDSINKGQKDFSANIEALPGGGPCRQMSHVGVYKCLLLIIGFAVTVTIWSQEVVLLQFHFTVCRYFFDHVTCWNLPWQGLNIS